MKQVVANTNKAFLIAVEYGFDDEVIGLAKVVNVNQNTYNALKNKYAEQRAKELKEKETLYKQVNDLNDLVKQLQHEINVLKGLE